LEQYKSKHPKCDSISVIADLCSVSTGAEGETEQARELRKLFAKVWKDMHADPKATLREVLRPDERTVRLGATTTDRENRKDV
jgi:hypothetical protein